MFRFFVILGILLLFLSSCDLNSSSEPRKKKRVDADIRVPLRKPSPQAESIVEGMNITKFTVTEYDSTSGVAKITFQTDQNKLYKVEVNTNATSDTN